MFIAVTTIHLPVRRVTYPMLKLTELSPLPTTEPDIAEPYGVRFAIRRVD